MFPLNCPNCNEIINYKSQSLLSRAKRKKILCSLCKRINSLAGYEDRYEIIDREIVRKCLQCADLIYCGTKKTSLNNYMFAIKRGIICRKCDFSNKELPDAEKSIFRNCPKCNKNMKYSAWEDCRRASKRGSLCLNCAEKKPFSEEVRKKMSILRKGRKKSELHKLKIGLGNKGKILSEETKKKISFLAKKRYSNPEERAKASVLHFKRLGTLPTRERNNWLLAKWSKKCREKVPFCEYCIWCEDDGIEDNLEAHHIMPKSKFPQYQYDERNCLVLCAKHHTICHKQGGY